MIFLRPALYEDWPFRNKTSLKENVESLVFEAFLAKNYIIVQLKQQLPKSDRTMRIISLLIFIWAFSSTYGQANEDVSLPHYPDWMYQKRLEDLNKKTSISLDYNEQVRAYIDVYTVKRREHLSKIIGRADLYFPLFEEYLDKFDLPLELKYLAIVESALDPCAKSKSGAMGLWQFLYNASKMFDLKVDTYVDERCDPVKSTIAACKYLRYLHDNLNDWQLALAAYNGGIGVVQKAIERSGGKTSFWELQPYLPAEVKSYVPAFIAVNYVMNNYSRHDVEPTPPLITYSEVDTVYTTKPLSFKQISMCSGTSIEVIKWLNPSYKKDYIPFSQDPVMLFLPKKDIMNFIKSEKQMKESKGPLVKVYPIGDITGRVKTTHYVARGEYFHKIALTYRCRISDIMKWNNMHNREIRAGQKLIVWKPEKDERFFFVTEEFASSEKLGSKTGLLAKK